jgi:hypothetical protein
MKLDYVPKAVRGVGERERREYDAFGPWVMEVKESQELPPSFDPYWNELRSAAIVAKVPYHVERRDALPGSELYEHLIAVGSEALTLLSIKAGSAQRRNLDYARVSSISLVSSLLDGHLVIGDASGQSLELGFNTVSEKLVRAVIDRIRPRCLAPGRRTKAALPGPDLVLPPGEDDSLFMNKLAEFRSTEAPVALLAYQEPCRVKLRDPEALSPVLRALATLRRRYFDSVMLLETTSELILLRESDGLRRRKARGHRYEITWLPLASLKGVAVEELAVSRGAFASIVHLSVVGHEYALYFAAPPDSAVTRLEALVAAGTFRG